MRRGPYLHRAGAVRSAGPDPGLTLIRPARKDERQARTFPNWLRQRVEAVIWTLESQLGDERHGGRVPAGLSARIVERLLALNARIWHNGLIGAPVKRSLIACDHILNCPRFPIADLARPRSSGHLMTFSTSKKILRSGGFSAAEMSVLVAIMFVYRRSGS